MARQVFFASIFLLLTVACDNQSRKPELSSPLSAQTSLKQASSSPTAIKSAGLPLYRVGQITRHAKNFLGQHLRLEGYLLQKEVGYVIFSDEAKGPVGFYDLPVVGVQTATIQPGTKYILEGVFSQSRLLTINHNPYSLKLSNIAIR